MNPKDLYNNSKPMCESECVDAQELISDPVDQPAFKAGTISGVEAKTSETLVKAIDVLNSIGRHLIGLDWLDIPTTQGPDSYYDHVSKNGLMSKALEDGLNELRNIMF